ncbi:MAG: hypothetical protein D6791_07800 [Chloroflexi bacterium]|nr:MAG: hypothetical protein D6791_07800 [Chloroflexota bacterium]
MRKLAFALIIIAFAVMTHRAGAETWYGYGTGFGTSSWSGFKVDTFTYYRENVYESVRLRKIYTHIDNRQGTEWTNCASGRVVQGDGTIPVWDRDYEFDVAPGEYRIDTFWLGEDTYYKYGQEVYTESGATLTGNCGAFFGGWAVRFLTDGSITKEWRE